MSDKSTRKDDKKSVKDGAKSVAKKDVKFKNVKKSSAKDASKKTNPFKAFGKFVREYRSELRKISWPTAKDTTKNALITMAAILIVGVFIWVLDYGLSNLRDVVIKKIPEWSVSSEPAQESPVTSDSSLIVSVGDTAE